MTGRRILAAAAATLLACAELSAQAAGPLRFCVPADNLPMAAAFPPSGIEVETARALAARMGVEAEFEWLEPHERPDHAVLDGRCDVAPGAVVDPGPMAQGRVIEGLALTAPYYGAGYLLIRSPGAAAVRRLAELADTRIGVETESVPIYTLKQRGHRVFALDDYDAVVRAVADGRVRYGYLWGPLAAWLLRDRSDVVVESAFEPEERWDFALVVRAEDQALREALNRAIAQLVRGGEVQRIFAAHGVPFLEPGAGRAAGAGEVAQQVQQRGKQ